MFGWLKSIFGNRPAEQPNSGSAENSDLLKQFELFLTQRMDEFRPSVQNAFVAFFKSGLEQAGQGLHIEVFLDEPAFSLRAFSTGKNDAWQDEPASVEELNETLERLWPIVTEAELDRYTIWEDDPKWGRQVALEQPLDQLNIQKLVLPWLRGMISESRAGFSGKITVSTHDITRPEEL